ncbi:MAG: DUF1826 domain-containing protein [Rhodobacteraceae bacterium]|nr:DUF1826 domain-containing protein [Paracoccaceae bacterium]
MNAPSRSFGSVVEGHAPEVLARIAQPGVALAVWRRAPHPDFACWIDAVPPERLPRLRARVAAGHVADVVTAACDAAGLKAHPMRAWLAEDAGALGAIVAEVLESPFLGIRLDVIDTDACRRFHLDRVRARMLCTYRGTGTEYGQTGPDGGPPTRTARLARGEAGLFRGALWAESDQPGLVHRSPPIEGTGETRLLLVLDAAGPEDEAE